MALLPPIRVFPAKIVALRKCEGGSAAIEFALVAPVFLGMVFAIFEVGIFYLMNNSVESASLQAARIVRTGQASGFDREGFVDQVCSVMSTFGSCREKVTVETTRYNSFAALAADNSEPTCLDADQEEIDDISFQPGTGLDIVRVRVCYLYRPMTPGIGIQLARTSGGQVKVISESIVRNEPF